MKKISRLGILFAILLPIFVWAQFSLDTDDLSLEITPALPGARETVQAHLESFSVDLNRSEVFWYVNEKLQTQGIGLRDFSFVTGDLGKTTKVDVVVRGTDGVRISRTFSIQPAEVDILWNAHTYTPPFYKGRSLASSDSLIKLVAVPQFFTSNGSKIGAGNLIYTWEQDGVVLGRLSGFGQDSIVLKALPVPRGRTFVTVTVSSFSNTLQASKTVEIRTQNPEILFYEKHPLEGVKYEHALQGNFILADQEVILRAEPFFFSIDDLEQDDGMEYLWFLNGNELSTLRGDPREITLRQEKDLSGVAELELSIENVNRLLQFGEKKLQITFGLSPSLSR